MSEAVDAFAFIRLSINEVRVPWSDPETEVAESAAVEQLAGVFTGNRAQATISDPASPDRAGVRGIQHHARILPKDGAKPVDLTGTGITQQAVLAPEDAVPYHGAEGADATKQLEALHPGLHLSLAASRIQ